MKKDTGKLYVVATPIGNLGDITQRAQEILRSVTLIAAEDTRHSQGLLQHLGIATPLVSYHTHNERERAQHLIEKMQQGESIALISDAGTPLISDPGYWLVHQAHMAGVPVVPIPGACAAIAVLSVSGLSTDQFFFEGFLPSKGAAREARLTTIEKTPYTTVLYEAPHRLHNLFTLCQKIFEPTRQFVLAREVTKRFETIMLSDLQTLVAKMEAGEIPEKGECIVVIEGKTQSRDAHDQREMEKILRILLPEMPLKQAVGLAVKLTDFSKNALYDCAMKIKEEGH